MAEKEKKGLSTNSNTYTIIYSVVMVVIVAFLLSFVNSVLKEKQTDNVNLDKMKQILGSIGIEDVADAKAEYDKYIKVILDSKGTELGTNDFTTDAVKNAGYVIYKCDVDGATKYIVPLDGNGLWGAIWGYVALNDDKSTVYGIYFNHASETPGLGAEIVTPAFKEPFKGKQILKNGELKSIAVVKKGASAEGQDYVDGISGGTITSVAVSDMIANSLKRYEEFLTK
jgi:Na+-transporting NADH:ubiquinone oxidoreductase subunit C